MTVKELRADDYGRCDVLCDNDRDSKVKVAPPNSENDYTQKLKEVVHLRCLTEIGELMRLGHATMSRTAWKVRIAR